MSIIDKLFQLASLPKNILDEKNYFRKLQKRQCELNEFQTNTEIEYSDAFNSNTTQKW